MRKYTLRKPLNFHKLKWSNSPDDQNIYHIVRIDTDDNIELDETSFIILKRLYKGQIPQEIISENISQTRITQVIKFLEDAKYLKQDNTSVEKIRPWFKNIPRKYFIFAILPLPLTVLYLFIATGLFLGITNSNINLDIDNYYWHKDILFVYIINYLLFLLMDFSHEAAHFITTKAIGGEARITFSYRYLYFIFQTDNYYISIAPKAKRYLVYIAGITSDLIWIAAACYILHYFGLTNAPFVIQALSLVILLNRVEAIAWQCNFFLETDLYNIFSDWLNQPNLITDTQSYLKKTIAKFLYPLAPSHKISQYLHHRYTHHTKLLQAVPKETRSLIQIYTLFFIFGITVVTTLFLALTLPRELLLILIVINNLKDYLTSGNVVEIIKSLIVLTFAFFAYAALLIMYLRKINLFLKKRFLKQPVRA